MPPAGWATLAAASLEGPIGCCRRTGSAAHRHPPSPVAALGLGVAAGCWATQPLQYRPRTWLPPAPPPAAAPLLHASAAGRMAPLSLHCGCMCNGSVARLLMTSVGQVQLHNALGNHLPHMHAHERRRGRRRPNRGVCLIGCLYPPGALPCAFLQCNGSCRLASWPDQGSRSLLSSHGGLCSRVKACAPLQWCVCVMLRTCFRPPPPPPPPCCRRRSQANTANTCALLISR